MKVNKNLNYGRLYWPQTDKYTKSVKSTKQKYTVISQNRMKVWADELHFYILVQVTEKMKKISDIWAEVQL